MPKIVSFRSLGKLPACDIEVMHPDHQFYLANGLLTSNSAHAKSYGMVTMQTAYLRTYHPLEFLSAVLTCGQADDLQGYADDIRRQGFKLLPVDVNTSKKEHVIEGDAIRLSLCSVKGVGDSAVEKIIAGQPYVDLLDFIYRSGVGKTVVENLILVGAFSASEPNIRLLHERHDIWARDPKMKQKRRRAEFESLYTAHTVDADYDLVQRMQLEEGLIGFSLHGTPFAVEDRTAKVQMAVDAGLAVDYADFVESGEQMGVIPVALRSYKEREGKGTFAFMKFLTRDGVEFESVCFSTVWRNVKPTVRTGDVYLVTFSRRPEDPTRLIVGGPGFAHSARTCANYFIRVDEIDR